MLKLVVLLAAFLSGAPLARHQSGATGAIPEGWYVYPEGKLKAWEQKSAPNPCPSVSLTDWKVSNEGDSVKIIKLPSDRAAISRREEELPLPPLMKHEKGMPGNTARAFLKSVLHLKNNWLLAYDAGEWGGGLWLTNEDGSKTKRILSDNVREMIPMDEGVLVLSGLSHGINFGNAFIFSNPEELSISLEHAVHLDGEPSGYAKEPNGSVLFLTLAGLCRITPSGELQRLGGFSNGSPWAFTNSMVIASDGSIFIGTRMFVVRLRKNSDRYAEEWLLPKECR
jgi:hypothetical protein